MFRKILVNAGKLLCGSSLNAIMGLITAALAARTLGAGSFGILVFIQAFALIIGQLLSFNAWQAVVTFGSRAQARGDESALHRLLKAALVLDIVGGLAGFFLARVLAGPVIGFLEWPEDTAALILFFSPAIVFSGAGAAAGTLRLYGRFGLLAVAQLVAPAFRLIGTIIGYIYSLGISDFVLIYLGAAMAGQLVLMLAAARVVGWSQVFSCLLQPLTGVGRHFPGFWQYVFTTNLHSTVKMLTREADQLLAAAMISPASLGLLKISRQFARILPMITEPLYQTLFTELSQLHATRQSEKFNSLIYRSAISCLFIGLIGLAFFAVAGKPVISVAFGSEFTAAWPAAMIFMLALVFGLAGLPLQPAMLAVGRPEVSFRINLLSTMVYLALIVPLTRFFGIEGAAAAYVLYYLIWVTTMKIRLRKELQTR
jgi:O-antigen/teichoic acid export membrane protein